jgi:uncharacterized phiE125 gp8 family phage protein
MMLTEVTALPQAVLPVAQFRDHLRLGSGFDDDALQDGLIETYLRAAIAAIEARIGKILIERDFVWVVTQWREGGLVALPVAPVNAITEFTIVARDGTETAIPDTAWRLIPDHQRPVLEALGASLPSIPQGGAARIGFMAGFGPDWSDLPADLAQAALMLAAHFYENRNASGRDPAAMPFGVAALLERYRTIRLFVGGRA